MHSSTPTWYEDTSAIAPTGSSCVGVLTPAMIARSNVATVSTLNVMAAIPTFPPEILVFDMLCSLSTTTMPKKRLFVKVLWSTLQQPLLPKMVISCYDL